MSASNWGFRKGEHEHTIELEAPDNVSPAAGHALTDFIAAEIGDSKENLAYYRETWNRISSGLESRSGISGNGTLQRRENEDVVLESKYQQWEPVRISSEQFEEFLDQFAEFLKGSAQRLLRGMPVRRNSTGIIT